MGELPRSACTWCVLGGLRDREGVGMCLDRTLQFGPRQGPLHFPVIAANTCAVAALTVLNFQIADRFVFP